MKKKLVQFNIFILIFINIILNCACKPKKPWSYRDVVWFSNSPEMVIIKAEDYYLEGYLKYNNKELKIELIWGPSKNYFVIDLTKDDGKTSVVDISFFYGNLDYTNNTVTLNIETDNLFDGKYKKIVLRKKPYVKGEYSFSPCVKK